MKNIWSAAGFISSTALMLSSALVSPSLAAPSKSGDAVIINTGDRFLPGYRVTVDPDGRLNAVLLPHRGQTPIHRTDRMISLNERRFFEDLSKAEPLESLPVGAVPALAQGRQRGRNRQPTAATISASGPQVFIRYRGRQSPNLRGATSTAGRVLYQDIKQILQVLRLPIPNTP